MEQLGRFDGDSIISTKLGALDALESLGNRYQGGWPVTCFDIVSVITLRRANHRRHVRRNKQEAWHTFDPEDRADPLADGFGLLESLGEYCVPPSASLPRRLSGDAEVLTYVREGALAYEDSSGRSGVVHAGEFQRMTTCRGVRHSATNASRTDSAQVFQLWLRPSEAGLVQSYEQRRFSTADRRGALRVIASADGQRNSLRIHPNARLYSALLDPGQHVVHEMEGGWGAWLHVVRGEVVMADAILDSGDGAGIDAERAVSIRAREEAELLFLDFDLTPSRYAKPAGAP